MKPDRDRILEQALKHELRDHDTPPGPACLDAETLAAWSDGGLDTAAVAAIEAHASSCARCQELIAAMARTLPAPPTTSNPAGASAGAFSWWKWLVPVSAAAAAAMIWMVVPGQRQLATTPPEPPAAARAAAPPRADDAKPASPSTVAEPQANKVAAEAPRALAKESDALAKDKDQKLADATPSERTQALNSPALKAEQPAIANAQGAPAAPAAPPPPVPAAAPVARQEAFATQSLDQAARRAVVAGVEVISPDPRRRWRVTADSIERTDDGGASWAMVHLLRGESLAAGSSPATTVCWFVGTGGTVMITVDASVFTHVDVPGRPDLRSIVATDARSAIVTAADGRRFRTDDSGRNWREN